MMLQLHKSDVNASVVDMPFRPSCVDRLAATFVSAKQIEAVSVKME